VLGTSFGIAACAGLIGFPDVPDNEDGGSLEGGAAAEAGPDGASGADGAPSDAGADAVTAVPDCGAPTTACNGQCVSLLASGTNCGACGHGCGDPTDPEMGCNAGNCRPVLLASDGPIVGLAVDQGSVFLHVEYDSGAGGVDEVAASTGIVKAVFSDPNEPITYDTQIGASGGNLFVELAQGYGALQYCAESNCSLSSAAPSMAGDVSQWIASGNDLAVAWVGPNGDWVSVDSIPDGGGFRVGDPTGKGAYVYPPMAIDDANFVFNYQGADASAGVVRSCTLATGCPDSALTLISTSVPDMLNVFNGTVYLTISGSGAVSAQVSTCPVAGCTTPAAYVNAYPTTIVATAVDASGFYWVDSTGSIWRCKPGGCNKSGVAVTNVSAGDPPAAMFALSGGFIYLVDAKDTTKVYRLAEPL
jgi:hypothetical protein